MGIERIKELRLAIQNVRMERSLVVSTYERQKMLDFEKQCLDALEREEGGFQGNLADLLILSDAYNRFNESTKVMNGNLSKIIKKYNKLFVDQTARDEISRLKPLLFISIGMNVLTLFFLIFFSL